MSKHEDIKNEIELLIKEGNNLYNGLGLYKKNTRLDSLKKEDHKKIMHFFISYEEWYTKALSIVSVIMPIRYDDFILCYKNPKRKSLDWKTYTLSDAVQQISATDSFERIILHPAYALPKLGQQISIVKSCLDTFDSRIYNIKATLQADIFDSEIDSARHLLDNGFIRASGAICGVVLEKHLSEVCQNHDVIIRKKNPSIADFNDKLKDEAYDTVEWRKIQHLGDIRNLCDHNKKREPTVEEVDELIRGTDRVIKNIF